MKKETHQIELIATIKAKNRNVELLITSIRLNWNM